MKVKPSSQTRINPPIKTRGGSSEGSQSMNNINHKNSFQSMQQPSNNFSQNYQVSSSNKFLPPMLNNQSQKMHQFQNNIQKNLYSNQIKGQDLQSSQQITNNINQASNINNQKQNHGNSTETINAKILQALKDQKQQKMMRNNNNNSMQNGESNQRLVTDPDTNDNSPQKKNISQSKKFYTLRQNSQNGNINGVYNHINGNGTEKKTITLVTKQRKSYDTQSQMNDEKPIKKKSIDQEGGTKKSGTAPTSEIQNLIQYTQSSSKNQQNNFQNNNFLQQQQNYRKQQNQQKQVNKQLLLNNTVYDEKQEYEDYDTSKLNQQQMREKIMIEQKIKDTKIHASKISQKKNGQINSYAANTHPGLFRGYNEDRVAIILNISKPQNKAVMYWPKCSYFAVYDGHGGNKCSDYLRDQMHQFIINDENFPSDPISAIKNGVRKTDQQYLQMSEQMQDRSGSCAVIALVVDDICYIVNIGDSRAILSRQGGLEVQEVTQDHKPSTEEQRIKDAGGMVYQVNNNGVPQEFNFAGISMEAPHRVFPGKLSVCRTIGDIEAKVEKYGGNSRVVISDPDIFTLNIKEDFDFVLLASDGIFDRITSEETVQVVWNSIKSKVQEEKEWYRNGEGEFSNQHQLSAHGVENLLRKAFQRKTLDNVTVVMVTFSNFENIIQQIKEMDESIYSFNNNNNQGVSQQINNSNNNNYNNNINNREQKMSINSMNNFSQNQYSQNNNNNQYQNQSFNDRFSNISNSNFQNNINGSQNMTEKFKQMQNNNNNKLENSQQALKKVPDQKLKIIVHQKNMNSIGNSKGISPNTKDREKNNQFNNINNNSQISRNTGKHFRNLSHQQQNSTNFSQKPSNDISPYQNNNNNNSISQNKQLHTQQQQSSGSLQQGKHTRNYTGYALQRQQNNSTVKHLKNQQLNEGYYYQPKNQQQQQGGGINSQMLTIQQSSQDKGQNNNSKQYGNGINIQNTTQKRSFSQPFNALFSNSNTTSNNNNNLNNNSHLRQNSFGSKRQIQSVQIKNLNNSNQNFMIHHNKSNSIQQQHNNSQNNSPIKLRISNIQH